MHRLGLPRGVRVRLLLSFLVLLTASTAVSTLALRQILQSRLDARVEAQLSQEVEEFRRLARQGRDPRTGRPFGSNLRAVFDLYLSRNVPNSGEDWLTFLSGEPYRSTTVGADVERRLAELGGADGPVRGELGEGDAALRFLVVPVQIDGRRRGAFAVTQQLRTEGQEIDQAVRIAAGVSLAVLAVASAIAFFVAGRVLAPLRDLTDTARAITETDLTRRIDAVGKDEIAELGLTFNAMLDRIEAAFGSQRAFLSDAGHELRTPITIIRGHLELLGDDPADRADTIAVVTDELDRMSRMVDDLLTLARAERSDFLRLEDLDLDLVTEELLQKAEGLGDREWVLEATGTGRLTADRQRLTQAVMNLAGNAVTQTGPGDRIALGSALGGGEARLWVTDAGPGVPDGEAERIFERFARAGRRQSADGGAGLGLAIVRAIAEAHDGRVEVASRPGHGATFTLTLPTEPTDATPGGPA